MATRRFHMPSPALVLSTVALSLVLGGTAFAATTDLHTDKKADAKLVKKLAPSLSVKYAKAAGTAASAATATHAMSADLVNGVQSKDVAWIQGGRTGAVSLPDAKGTWTTVAKTTFTTAIKSSWYMAAQDNISFSGSSTTGEADLRFLVNGVVDDGLDFPNSLAPSSTQAITGVINCNGMPAGTYLIQVQVSTVGGNGTFSSDAGTLAVTGAAYGGP